MKYLTLFIIMAILAIYVIKRIRESFMETSYYYEAAPGARGSRLICMPEARGTASLGIDVNSAASKAVNSCAPLTMTYQAPKPKVPRIPTMCLQYMGQGKPMKPRPMSVLRPSTIVCPSGMAWDGRQCKRRSSIVNYSIQQTARPIKTSPGCPQGTVWDGKKCKIPSALVKKLKTSPGCRAGFVWDGKKCKVPSAVRAAIRDPSRPVTPKKKGKSIATPDGKVKYRKIGNKNLPFISVNGKWVRAKKVNGKWTVLKVKAKTGSKSNCPSGKKWDSKKKKCVKAAGKSKCPSGKKWDSKKKKCIKKN